MNHTQIIQTLIDRYNYQSYLEIGLDNPNNNYLLINCKYKECVDPYYEDWGFDAIGGMDNNVKNFIMQQILTYRMTSDEMFQTMPLDKKYDIIFIDGYHNEAQVDRDIRNSLKHLNKGGRIVVHDCLPENKEEQTEEIPNEFRTWVGTVWKSIPKLKNDGIEYYVVNTDCGCGVLKFDGDPETLTLPPVNLFNYDEVFSNTNIRNLLLNVISEEEFWERE